MTAIETIPEESASSFSVARKKRGYTCRTVDIHNPPRLAELAALIKRAWGSDYHERAVIRFDVGYLKWLMEHPGWFGIEVRNAEGQLVGFELALPRLLDWSGHALRAYYVTLLSVDPAHRGRGLAQLILQRLTEVALDERNADVLLSTFDVGAAGQPSVQKSIANSRSSMHLRLSEPMSLWACTADLREVDKYEPLQGLSRLALCPGVRSLISFSPGRMPDSHMPTPVSLSDVTYLGGLESGAGVYFGAGPAALYACRDDGSSGTWQFKFPKSQSVTVAWHISHATKPTLPDRPMGVIQFVVGERASNANLTTALRSVNKLLLERGCLVTTMLDTGAIGRRVLLRSGFRPTPRRVRFAVRGPARLLSQLPSFEPPYFVDLL